MKTKVSKVFAVAAVLFAFATTANAQNNDNALIGKARAAAHDCLQDARQNGMEIVEGVSTTGICIVQGELHEVTFWSTYRCNNEPCPKVMARKLATVYFDCDDNVSFVECANQ